VEHHVNMKSFFPILEIKDLKTYFFAEQGVVRAVDGVSFVIQQGEVMGLVGESGCGKSVTARSILRTLQPPGQIISGEILLEGENLLELPIKDMRKNVLGKKISMIFQDPMTFLNPVFTVVSQIMEPIEVHQDKDKREAYGLALEMMKKVGIASPEQRAGHYPHQFSGGMRQRVMIAMGLSCQPSLLIADEPTTALDVTIQAQILALLKKINEEMKTSILLITHNLGVIAQIADWVAVMYAGRIVESSNVKILFETPKHPYTVALLKCLPGLGRRREKLNAIPGIVPNLIDPLPGCRFSSRCDRVMKVCFDQEPSMEDVGKGQMVRCYLYK
jgi:oligopeptide/dipeptide ABC transporter ATP-binding protein